MCILLAITSSPIVKAASANERIDMCVELLMLQISEFKFRELLYIWCIVVLKARSGLAVLLRYLQMMLWVSLVSNTYLLLLLLDHLELLLRAG